MRKTQEIAINDRGTVKTFVFTEMGALSTQKWLLAVAKVLSQAVSGLQTDDLKDILAVFKEMGPTALFDMASKVDDERIAKLLAELVTSCYTYQGLALTDDNIDGFIDDVTTLFKLERFAVEQHLSFLRDVQLFSSPNGTTENKTEAAVTTNMPPTDKRTSAPKISRRY